MKRLQRGTAFFLIAAVLLSSVFAAPADEPAAAAERAAAWLLEAVPAPQPGPVGGEWTVLALARMETEVPNGYFEGYYCRLEELVQRRQGVLHEKKYTEYARTVLALTAIGKDPRDVGGYDLLAPLGDYDQTVWQGIMGPIMALLALDSGNYEMPRAPEGKNQAERTLYVNYILAQQLPDGGFSVGGETGDPDVTAMALQALAKYRGQEEVDQAVRRGVECLASLQASGGGYESWGAESVESVAQVIVALCELGVSPADERFVSEKGTLIDVLLSYACAGGFSHLPGGNADIMATEQAAYALAALARFEQGGASLYTMTDAAAGGAWETDWGLPGRDNRVRLLPVTAPERTFLDVQGHTAQTAIEGLARRGIVSGRDNDHFYPDGLMTRAEFATILVNALGLEQRALDIFSDVPADEWFAGAVGAAYEAGLVDGVGGGEFAPQGSVTRQEAAAMVARAAALCGLDMPLTDGAVLNILAQFPDYRKSGDWAREPLAFCYQAGILDENELEIRPQDPALRWEVAEMVWRLLERAKLTGEGVGP